MLHKNLGLRVPDPCCWSGVSQLLTRMKPGRDLEESNLSSMSAPNRLLWLIIGFALLSLCSRKVAHQQNEWEKKLQGLKSWAWVPKSLATSNPTH